MRQLFGPFGELAFVTLHRTPEGVSKGFCFIQYKLPEEAQASIDAMNGFEIGGRKLKVSWAIDTSLQGNTRNQMTDSAGTSVNSMGMITGEDNRGSLKLEDEGMTINATTRVELMAKLAARETSLQKPVPIVSAPVAVQQPSRCMLIKNAFDPAK